MPFSTAAKKLNVWSGQQQLIWYVFHNEIEKRAVSSVTRRPHPLLLTNSIRFGLKIQSNVLQKVLSKFCTNFTPTPSSYAKAFP